jgi:hypothetical protein
VTRDEKTAAIAALQEQFNKATMTLMAPRHRV